MTEATSQVFWKKVVERLHKIANSQKGADSKTVDESFSETLKMARSALLFVSNKYPDSNAASDVIRDIPRLLDKCSRYGSHVPTDLALETTKAILTAGYLLVNPMKPREYSDTKFFKTLSRSYTFPELSASTGQLYEEVCMRVIRLELA